MTKKSGKTKPEKSKAKPKKNGKVRTKRTAAELTSEQRQVLMLSHVSAVERCQEALVQPTAKLKAAYALADKEGFPKKQIDFAISLKTEEGIERAKAARASQDFAAVALNVPLGTQHDMGFPKQTAKEKAFADGRVAGASDLPGKPPKDLPTNMHQAWLAGFAEARTKLNVQRAESGFKPLGSSAKGVANKLNGDTELDLPPPTKGDGDEARAH